MKVSRRTKYESTGCLEAGMIALEKTTSWVAYRVAGKKRGAGYYSPNPLILLVAGRGFEPLTFGL